MQLSGPGEETGEAVSTDDGDIPRSWYVGVRHHTGAELPFTVYVVCSATSQATVRAMALTVANGDDRRHRTPETINGTAGPDVIAALGGTNTVNAGGSDDVVCGGAGADNLEGQGGTDRLFGQGARDRLAGGPGAGDPCHGGPGRDRTRSSCERTRRA